MIGGAQMWSLVFEEIDGLRRGRHRRWVDFGKAYGGRRRSRVSAVVAGFAAAFSVKIKTNSLAFRYSNSCTQPSDKTTTCHTK